MKKLIIFALAVLAMTACTKKETASDTTIRFIHVLNPEETKTASGILNAIHAADPQSVDITLTSTKTGVVYQTTSWSDIDLPLGQYKMNIKSYRGDGRVNITNASVMALRYPWLACNTSYLHVDGSKRTYSVWVGYDCFALVIDKHFATGIEANGKVLPSFSYGDYKVTFVRSYQQKEDIIFKTIPTEGNEAYEYPIHTKNMKTNIAPGILAEAGHYYLLTKDEGNAPAIQSGRHGYSMWEIQGEDLYSEYEAESEETEE